MNEDYFVDFCPPGFKFEKKVERIEYSLDGIYWRSKIVMGTHDEYCGYVTGRWQRFIFYDGTISDKERVPIEEQLTEELNATRRKAIR